MAFGWDDAIGLGISGISSIINGRSQARNQREQNRLQRRALDTAEGQYRSRSGFRDAAQALLSGGGAMQYFDPNAYTYRPVEMGDGGAMDAGAARDAADKAGNFNRLDYIKTALKNFDAEAEPQFQAGARRVGQRAAQFGALGKGTINTELGELEARTRRERTTLQDDLLNKAAEGTASDQFRTADLRRGLANDAFGRDQAMYGRRADEATRRSSLGRAALQDRLAALGANDRSLSVLGNLGYSNDPGDAYRWASEQAGQRASQDGESAGVGADAIGQILAWLRRNQSQGGTRPIYASDSSLPFNPGY